MNTPIVVDPKDPKWLLLDHVMDITTSRQVKQAMARHGVIPVEKAGTIIRILFISMFFSQDITFLLSELRKRKRLRQFAQIAEVPSAQSIYQFVSKFEESQFVHLIADILNSMCRRSPNRKFRKLIVDGSAITLDLNIFRRKFRKKDLLDRDFRWGFSNTRGYYLGFKLTLVVEYPQLLPLCVLLHPGSPHDSALFEEIMDELKCHWRCKSAHFRRDKNTHLTTFKQELEGSGNAGNGGLSHDTGSLSPGNEHQSNLPGDWFQPENSTEIYYYPVTANCIKKDRKTEQAR